jgi:N-acetylmuramoyl-L-alanine amidase CwlA
MVIKRKYFERDSKRVLKEIRALVVHWPAGKRAPELQALWKWMNTESINSYHFLVSQKDIIQTTPLELRAVHCGHATYTKKAIDYFGENVCGPNDSPNNYTIGICMLHDKADGTYETVTLESAIDLMALLCIDNNLEPTTDIFRHSDLTNEKEIPCPRYFFEDDDDPDDLWRTFLGWIRDRMTYYYREMGIEG